MQFDDVQLNNQELRKKSNIVSEDRVCKRYKKGICPHGLKGNKLYDGKKCDYEHPKYCIKYCRNGNQQKLGCNKGANCNFFHPVLYKNSVKSKVCTNIECKFIHLKGTRRKKSECPRPRHKTGAQTSTEDENTVPEHFLQLQRLVETMRAKHSIQSPAATTSTTSVPVPSTTNGSHNRNSSTSVPQPVSSPYSHVLQASQRARFSSFIFLNVQSINPSANSSCRWKVPEISSIVQEEVSKKHALPFIALTETWLKSYITDAQLHVPGYLVSRSDRDSRVGGGVLL